MEVHMYRLRIALLGAIGVLIIVSLGVIIVAAMPRPKYELVGSITEYSTSSEPYDLGEGMGFYLVNTGAEILALDERAPRNTLCRVKWDAPSMVFRDPCFGTTFDLDGEYRTGPPSKGLGRYRVRIKDQNIWVSVNSIDEGKIASQE
jgi:hypothetical protein